MTRTAARIRSVVLIAAAALALLGAGYTVYAAVGPGTASQQPSAVTRQAAQSLTVRGGAPGLLYPGAPAVRIPVSLTATTDEPITVTGLTTVLETSGLPAGCSGAWFRIVQSDVSTTSDVRVPANATVTLPSQDAPSIALTDSQTSQDACKGATLALSYSASTRSDAADPATPRLTWAAPDAIGYGTRLSDRQLRARASAAGHFVYDPEPDSLLPVGRHTLSASFRPRDTDAYTRATVTTSLVVEQAAPAIAGSAPQRKSQPTTVRWAAPRPLTYPAKLSNAQLNAEASLPGTFAYSPPRGSVPRAGRATLTATFSPSDASDHATTTATVQLDVAKGVPRVTWATPPPLSAGAPLTSTQLNAKASVRGAFVYSPAAGSIPLPGSHRLSAVFEPTDAGNYATKRAHVTLEVRATAPVPAGDLLAIDIDGKPGIKVVDGFVRITGRGLKPRSLAKVYARSTPQLLESARADAHGALSMRVALPAGLAVGGHHIEVHGTSASGAPIVEKLAFTVASGDRLGSIGSIPDGVFATLVPFEPAAHLSTMLAIMVGGFAALGALGAALGGAGGARSAGSQARGGGGEGGGGGSSDGAFLEDVEVERETMAKCGRGRGDRSKTWWWFFTRHVDRFSVEVPSRLAALSPVIGRVSVDGDYLRAMFGGLYVLLYPLAIGLGIAVAASTGGEALPPAFAWFVAILALSLLDAMVGYVAGLSFAAAVIAAGGVTGSASIRELSGIVLVWFAVPLAAGAVRPIRRHIRLSPAGLWDRAADFVIAGLFGGWLAANMVEALSPLAGFELPLAEQKWTIAAVVIGLVGIRLAVETIAAHEYPDRLVAVRHRGELESGTMQVAVALVCQILVFIFIAAAFMKLDWPLFVGVAVFFSPLVPWLFVDRLPKSAFVTRWMPVGLSKWAFVIIAGVLLSLLLEHLIHDPVQAAAYAFILLPLPILTCWGLELFAKEADEEENEHAADVQEGRVPMTWPLRLAGVPVLGLCVYLVLSG